MKNNLFTQLKRFFKTGLISLLPTVVVGYIFYYFLGRLQRATTWIYVVFDIRSQWWAELLFPVIVLLLGVVAIIIVGATSTTLFGRGFVRLWNRVIVWIPVLNGIYRVVQQIISAMAVPRSQFFKAVVLMEYPRPGIYRVGFITAESPVDVEGEVGLVSVFVPNTPNVTAGFYFLVSRNQLTVLDIPVEEAIKAIVTGGFVTSKGKAETSAPAEIVGPLMRRGRSQDEPLQSPGIS